MVKIVRFKIEPKLDAILVIDEIRQWLQKDEKNITGFSMNSFNRMIKRYISKNTKLKQVSFYARR